MSAVATADKSLWMGGESPFKVSFGKMMMWFFLISDTFTFAGFLIAYSALRYAQSDVWPAANDVFNSVPGLHGYELPLVFVSIMTFILILSSVTMVRAVQEGHMNNKWGVVRWMLPTIIGGIAFLYCQYLEWSHLMHLGMGMSSTPGFPIGSDNVGVQNFGQLFFTITGFHGLHVLFGVILNIGLTINVINGKYEKTGDYEIVEKIGLYWHFVDLVWVYVFLAFYLL